MLLLLFLFFWLKAYRWQMLLEPVRKLKVSEVSPAMMIGFMLTWENFYASMF